MNNAKRKKVFGAWNKFAGASLSASVILIVGLMQSTPDVWKSDHNVLMSALMLTLGIPSLSLFLFAQGEHVAKKNKAIFQGRLFEFVAAFGISSMIWGVYFALRHFNILLSQMFLVSIFLCIFMLTVVLTIAQIRQGKFWKPVR